MVRKYIKMAANYALKRLQERSTRMGIIAFLTSLGVVIDPAQLEAAVALGVAVMGMIEALTPDKAAEVIAVEK